jgi:hypothetical protein
VKEGIPVREFHFRSHWNDQEMRLKVLVVLRETQSISRAHKASRSNRLRAWHLQKPNNCFRRVRHSGIRIGILQLHSHRNVDILL